MSASKLYAADPPSLKGASSDVLNKKVHEESEEKVLQTPEYQEPVVEEEKPAESNAPEIRFHLTHIEMEGDPDIAGDAGLKPFLAEIEGREVSFEELRKVQKKIEGYYRAKGYLAAVYMPPQKVEGGEVTMRVLIYRMGDVHIEGQKYSRVWKILSFWKIRKGQKILYEDIRKSLIEMNQNPDREVRSYLKAAQEAGVIDIYLKVKDSFPVHAGYSFDNQGVRLTGKLRQGFTLRDNNTLGLDDIFLVGTSFGESFGAIFLQHLIPVNSRGTRFLWGFSHAQVDPQKYLAPFGVNSTSETYSLSLRQRLLTGRLLSDFYLGYDFKEKRTKVLSVTSTWDKLRILSFGGVFQWADAFGVWQSGQDFFFGLPFRGNGFPLTSRGGDSSFFKYGFSLERTQKIMWGTALFLKVEGQVTPDKLTPSEQLFMGGLDSVRGYPESDYGADNGILVRAEHQVPAFFFPRSWKLPGDDGSLREKLQLVSFVDYGYGNLRRPGEEERDNHKMLGAGGGFRMHFRKNIAASVFWGARLLDRGLSEGDAPSQFHFRLECDV